MSQPANTEDVMKVAFQVGIFQILHTFFFAFVDVSTVLLEFFCGSLISLIDEILVCILLKDFCDYERLVCHLVEINFL